MLVFDFSCHFHSPPKIHVRHQPISVIVPGQDVLLLADNPQELASESLPANICSHDGLRADVALHNWYHMSILGPDINNHCTLLREQVRGKHWRFVHEQPAKTERLEQQFDHFLTVFLATQSWLYEEHRCFLGVNQQLVTKSILRYDVCVLPFLHYVDVSRLPKQFSRIDSGSQFSRGRFM